MLRMTGKRPAVLWLWVFLFLLSLMPAHAESLQMLSSSHTVPKHFARGGMASGYAVDVGKEILRRAGYVPQARALPWARAIREGESGVGIMAPVFSRTPAREALFYFSERVMDDEVVLVQAADRQFVYRTVDDLRGKRVGTTRASRFSPQFNAVMPFMQINEDGEPQQRLAMLLAGRIDVAVVAGGVHAVRYNARLAGIPLSRLHIVKSPLLLDPNYFAIPKSHPHALEILQRINTAIGEMNADRSLPRLLEHYRQQY